MQPSNTCAFRPVEESDFPTLTGWLAEPHVRRFYQKTLVTLEQVALEYGPFVRGEEPTICHLAISAGAPFVYLQCYRNADYQEWADVIEVKDGISVDLFIGDPAYLHRSLGRAALCGYLQRVAFPISPARCGSILPTSRSTPPRSDAQEPSVSAPSTRS